MKEFLTEIKDKFNSKSTFSHKRTSPHIYWSNLLYVFFTIILILILFSFYLLNQIKNHQMFQVTSVPQETPNIINENLLNKINESFIDNTVKDTSLYNDPSSN